MESNYLYRFSGGLNNVYAFTTVDEVSYEIRFVPSAYMFDDYVNTYVDAFEMIIAVADNPMGGKLPSDTRTALTINTIFYDFFQDFQRVVIFICDSADGRHEARARKFTNWYYNGVRTHYVKFDARIPDGDIDILFSIILHDQNTRFDDIVQIIKSLGRDSVKENQ